MATASVLFEKTQDEAGGVERSCSDDVIRDALTPMSLDLEGGVDALLSFCAVRWVHFLGVLSTPEEHSGHDHWGGFQQQS
jgi:hypothetical protein